MTTDELIRAAAILIPVFLFILASTWTVVGWLVNRLQSALTTRLDGLGKSLERESAKIDRVEKSFLELKAELPREYVRREDHIRYSAIIEAKVDGHAQALQTLTLKIQRALDNMSQNNGDAD